VKGKRPYISRGGETLAHGLDRHDVDPSGLDCLDVGASTAAAPTADRLESGDVFDARWGISP
jgi:hypothetical protein